MYNNFIIMIVCKMNCMNFLIRIQFLSNCSLNPENTSFIVLFITSTISHVRLHSAAPSTTLRIVIRVHLHRMCRYARSMRGDLDS